MTMLPSTTDSYGQAGSFCWIRTGGIGTVWRFVQFYVPLWACMAYAARVTLLTRRTLRLALHSHPNGAVQLRQQSLAMFPVILLIAWTFGTVNRIQNSIAPSSASFPLYLLQLLFGNLQGLMDAAAYAHSNLVRRGVRRAWLRWRGHGSRGRTKSLELRGNGDEAGEHAAPSVAVADGDDDDDDALSEDRIATPRVSAHHRFLGDGERDEGEKGDEDLSDVTHQIRAAYMQSLGLFDALGMHVDHAAFKRLADLSLLDREERELGVALQGTAPHCWAHEPTATHTHARPASSHPGPSRAPVTRIDGQGGEGAQGDGHPNLHYAGQVVCGHWRAGTAPRLPPRRRAGRNPCAACEALLQGCSTE